MPKPGWATLTVRTERLKGLESIYERDSKRPRTQKFGSWFDNYLYELTSYEEELERYGPFIELNSVADDHILLTDHLLTANKHVFVKVNSKKKRLECEEDGSSECVHVGFCFATPSIYRILIKNGFKSLVS